MSGIKKITAVILCALMAITAIPMAAFATDDRAVVKTGFCGEEGENLTWTLYDDGELVISGEGKMDWYDVENAGKKLPPWFGYYDDIDVITVEEGVTSIGRHAFSTGFGGEGGFDPASYYKINLPKSLEFVEDDMFYDIGKNRIPGQHLAYCYAGSEEEWKYVEFKTCSLTFSGESDGPVNRIYGVDSVFNIRPKNDFESLWFNGEEPEAFCELVRPTTGDIDIVTHYYASNPEAAKIEWYMVNEGKEVKVGEIATNEDEPVEIRMPEFDKGDVYMKAKILDADGNVIVSSENLWIGDASIKEPTFFDKVKMYFQIFFAEIYIIFYVFSAAIRAGLIPELFKAWFDVLIWWN